MSDTTTPTLATSAREIVFIDSRVKDPEILLEGLAEGVEVVYLDAQSDGLAQMAEALGESGEYSAVHVFAHGDDGQMWLGNTFLDEGSLAGHGDTLAALGRGLTEDGDLLLFVCDLGKGEVGAQFIATLAELTGADVAASDDRTGAGGDWELEVTSGSIESAGVLPANALAAYQHSLATRTVTNGSDSGTGSLRQTLIEAEAGDTITFSSNMTVNLDTQLTIGKGLVIDGDLNNDGIADVTLSGQYKTGVMRVNAGVAATLDGLTITQGLVAGRGGDGASDAPAAMGGGIFNSGDLTLNNVRVTGNVASGGGGGGGVANGNVGGGGGGGGALGGQNGGRGGDTGSRQDFYAGVSGSANAGGRGGGFNEDSMGGRGGTSTGGAGGLGTQNYSNGGAGGTASNGTISVGGGGGGSGWNAIGGTGGSASGGIFNDDTGILTIIGTSAITDNIAAGGGGGGGGGTQDIPANSASTDPGGASGKGVGAIWNRGDLYITAANYTALTNGNNRGASGVGGPGAGGAGVQPMAVNGIYNDGGFVDQAYAPAPTATVVVADSALALNDTSLVTITFSEAVKGFTNSDLSVANGTLSAVSSDDGGITWMATLTPNANVEHTSNVITVDTRGVTSIASGNAGTTTATSNNYAIDTQRPTATIEVEDEALAIGETTKVTITFSEAVTGFTNADLQVQGGDLSAVSSSDGGVTWTATLTPASDTSNAGNFIVLDNSGITDLAGNAGTGNTESNDYAVDTVRPTATIVLNDNTLTAGESTFVTITFNEAVTGFTNADLTVVNGALSTVSSSDGGIIWTATFTPNVNVNEPTNIIRLANSGVADFAGNAGTGVSDSDNFTVDTRRPTATVVVAETALVLNDASLVTITFSEAVTGFSNSDLSVANGTLSAVSSDDGGITWMATLTPNANVEETSNVITLDTRGVTSAASGNAGTTTATSNNYAIDTQRPTATIKVEDEALAIGETTKVTITFSEAVTGFTNADLQVQGGGLSAVNSVDGGVTWTATLTPANATSRASNFITLDNTGIRDLPGNVGTGTTSSNEYAVDTQRPTATITMSDWALSGGETSVITITFTEPVTGFTNTALTVPNGTLSPVSSSDGGTTWSATFTPDVNVFATVNQIALSRSGATDAAGNPGEGIIFSDSYSVDTRQPTATVVVADSALALNDTSLVTITFSEAVTGFDNSDVSVANGTLSAVSSDDGGITWRATLTPNANVEGTGNVITVDTRGVTGTASGNAGTTTATSNSYVIDTQRPTATIVVDEDALAIGATSKVTITFSEAVTGFTNADLQVQGGNLSAVSSADGGVTWTATLTPASDTSNASNLIVLDNSGVTDLAGNAGTGNTESNDYAVDTRRPTAVIMMDDQELTGSDTAQVIFTFSEEVTGFSNAALTVVNGTLSTVEAAGDGKTWTATFTPNVNVNDPTNLIVLNNTAVIDLAGNAGVGTTNTQNFSIDTRQPTATVVVADSALALNDTSLVTITFSEAVTDFTNSDVSVANGTLSAVSSDDGGITWMATLTPNANVEGTGNVITVDTRGVTGTASGNAGTTTATSNSYAIDTQRPTATIVVDEDVLAIGMTSVVTITFSEAVNGFSNSDLFVSGGTLSPVETSDGGITWTGTLTPGLETSSAGNLIALNNAGVTDLSGNTGSGVTTSNAYAIDTQAPTATIVIADATLTAGETALVTITFSEAVPGLTSAALTVPNGTLTGLSTRDGGIIWTATFIPTPGTTEASNLITLDLSAVVDTAGNAGTGTVESDNYAVDTTVPPPPPAPPANPSTTVDGAQVSVSVGADGSTTTTIAPVVDSRVDDPATANVRLADVTVVRTTTGVALLDVGLPVGTGVTANGPANTMSAANAQSVLARQVTGASGTTEQQASAQAFLASLPANTQVVVQTVTVTAQAANGGPLVISALNTQDGHRTAVVVDTRSLPAGTLIDLENIDFAVIVGNARVTGGAGANIAYGDDDSQFIVLGEGDDVLHGLGGNDTVGSLRGNDQVFGDAGDDIVYGGSGDDTLTGGTGNDAMNGGFGFDTGVQSGVRTDYTVRTENGSVVLTHRTSGEVDRFTDVERIIFDSGRAIVVAHEASDVADLRARLGSDELIELNLTRAVPGSDANDVVTPTLGVALNIDLGAGQDVVKLAGGRDDVHLDVEAGQVVHLTRLEDGAMLGLKNVELLEFANGDVTVLAQNHDQAIVGRAYELLLGRNVDVAGFQFWADALNAGVSLQNVLQLMVTSQEAAAVYKLANGNFIEQLYVQGLDRASDAAGKAYWADALASGVSRAVVLEGFAGSAEAVDVIGSTVDVNVVS